VSIEIQDLREITHGISSPEVCSESRRSALPRRKDLVSSDLPTLPPFPEGDHMKRLQENLSIQIERKITDVVEIIGKLHASVLERCTIGIVYLSPTSDSGTHKMTEMIVMDFLFIVLHKTGPLGTGADHAHVPAQHVPELRKLIDTGLPQEGSESCDTGILLPGVFITLVTADLHAPKLVESERPTVNAYTLLREDHGSSV
jgi:hypothetical protein